MELLHISTMVGIISIFSQINVLAENSVECYPACRSGFTCYQGNCVSLCNPPCPDKQVCTSSGECVGVSQSIPSSNNGKQVYSQKQDKEIQCTEIFVVKPQMDASNVPGNFEESELLSASTIIANAIVKKKSSSISIISNDVIESVQKCKARLVVAHVKSYYKVPAKMGQYQAVITVLISVYDSPQQQSPTRTEEFTAKGDRHWGDSVPLQNAIQSVCRKIKSNFKL